jgi:hypothetical protein
VNAVDVPIGWRDLSACIKGYPHDVLVLYISWTEQAKNLADTGKPKIIWLSPQVISLRLGLLLLEDRIVYEAMHSILI